MTRSQVNVILGPAKSGKTERALTRYAEFLDAWQAAPSRPAGVWIGPTLSALSDVRDRLADKAQDAWLNPRTATFANLAEELILCSGRRVRAICRLEKLRILRHVVGRLNREKRLARFASVAAMPGFMRQVSDSIADLKRRDIWAEDFRDRVRDDRDRDMAAIYGAYQEFLHAARLYDAEGRFWAARDALTASPSRQGGAPQFGLVVLDGFADFTTAQHDLLRLLAARSEELLITLPAEHADTREPRHLLFDKPRRTLDLLNQSFPQLRMEIIDGSRFHAAGLSHVERHLFSDYPAGTTPSTEGLTIVAASSIQNEIAEVARRVKSLILAGTRPDEIAVVFPSVVDVANRIDEAFADFGLPYHVDHRTPLRSVPFWRTSIKLLELHVADWSYERLLDVVGNEHLQLATAANLDLEPLCVAGACERCIRRAQLPSGRGLILDQLREWANVSPELVAEFSRDRQQLVRDASIARAVFETLNQLLTALPTTADLVAWLASWESLLAAVGTLGEEQQPLWRFVQTAIRQLSDADRRFGDSNRTFDLSEFLSVLDLLADEVMLSSQSDSTGCIRVLGAEAARNLSTKHLFLAGLSESSYSSAEDPGPLYREQEIHRFSDETDGHSPEKQVSEAMLLFYNVVTRASGSLTLSYPAIDDKGQALSPSPYLTEIERCSEPSRIATYVMPPGEVLDLARPALSRNDWRLAAVAGALDGNAQLLAELVATREGRELGRAILRGIESVASRSDREIFGPFEGILTSPEARAQFARRFNGEHLWSASQLETYAMCPFQFYAQHILRLEPLEGLVLRSDHLRRGNLLHQVLAAVHQQSPAGEEALVDHELIDRFSQILERVIHETPLCRLEEALREIERREILAWAPRYAEQEIRYRQDWQGLRPTYFEVRFGPQAAGDAVNDAVSTLVPFTLDLGGEQIKLTGQIDRIDMGQVNGVTVFNIIDYKSGREVKLCDDEIRRGRQLQLPLYAIAAEKLLFADQQAVALTTGYWSVKAEGFASGGKAILEMRTLDESGLADSERWGKLGAPVIKRVAEIVRDVRQAEFPVYSEKLDCTKMCSYSKICRVAQLRSLEKVWISESTSLSQETNN